MRQFDSPKSKQRGGQDDDVANDSEDDLQELQEGLYALEDEVEEGDEDAVENDRVSEEEVDKMQREMMAKEIKDLERCIKPMCLVLTKVNSLSNCHVMLQLTRFSFARLPTRSKTRQR